MFILGVNSAYHESSACLIGDGRIIAAVEEERFNRIKHAKRASVHGPADLPWQAIDFCLRQGGIGPGDVDHVGYSFVPDARRQDNIGLRDGHRARPGDFGSPEGEEVFYRANLAAGAALNERFARAELHYIEHHLCHAASAYTVSPHARAAVLAVDGIGEHASTWLGIGERGKVRRLARIPYPHSLGFVWEKMSELLGFDAYSGPGKMMGYGCITDPYGELSGKDHLEAMREIVRLHDDGSFWVSNEVMRFRTDDFSQLERRFGRRRSAPVDRYEDASIAAALQHVTEDALLNLARGLHRMVNERAMTPIDTLCLAGGVALNCVANDRLLREGPFEKLWVQPAANDAGTAIGAAAYLHCQRLGLPGRPRMDNAFLGPAFSDDEIEWAIGAAGMRARRIGPETIADEVARRLDEGQLVAWFQGALEFGPRALGHRSILADPTRFDTRDKINDQVKLRESFRPFAPSVAAEEVSRFFDLPPASSDPADYMLLASPLRDDRMSQVIPAVVQENGSNHRSTSRLHRVRADVDPLYHRLIESFAARRGVGAVLNTSFNINEPIVATPRDALRTFAGSRLDALAIGPFLVERGS